MKGKITKIAIVAIAFITIIFLLNVLFGLYNKKNISTDDLPGSRSSVSSQVKFYPENEYNNPFAHYCDVLDGYRYECEIKCEVNQGALLFAVYETDGNELKGKSVDEVIASLPIVRQERIEISGEFRYELDLPEGKYFFYIGAEDEEVVAEASYMLISTRLD
jgi:hypothetical protein